MTAGDAHIVAVWLTVGFCCAASLCAIFIVLARPLYGTAAAVHRTVPSSASILIRLCGTEPRLYENLVTFFEQNHPRFQLLLVASSPDDPAIPIVRRLYAAYPHCDIELVVDSRVHDHNPKVSDLVNLVPHARYDLLVLADGDMPVNPDYLRTLTAPLADHPVGLVTGRHRTRPIGMFRSKSGARISHTWLGSSVPISPADTPLPLGLGATLVLHKLTLARMSGPGCLTQDYGLTRYAHEHGFATLLTHRATNPKGLRSAPLLVAALLALQWLGETSGSVVVQRSVRRPATDDRQVGPGQRTQ